jgi:excisionase family DNA binding protein
MMTEQTRSLCLDRLAVSPIEAARIAGIGKTKLYEAMGSGELRSFKIGKRRLILIDELRNWLNQHSRNAPKSHAAKQSNSVGRHGKLPPRRHEELPPPLS